MLPMSAIHRGRTADELIVYEVVTENSREVVRMRKVALGDIYNNQVEILPTAARFSRAPGSCSARRSG
jgi:hypothetical protein